MRPFISPHAIKRRPNRPSQAAVVLPFLGHNALFY